MTRLREQPLIVKVVLVSILVTLGFATAVAVDVGGFDPGPEQPIPFSHEMHATDKDISCFFCHPNAMDSANAGIPPVDKCLLCHEDIASNFGPIRKIMNYDLRQKGIPWVRIVRLPDYVRFPHRSHIAEGKDCGDCHGDVKHMDRLYDVKGIDMDFCVSCHWKNKVSVDCFLCHY